MRIMTRVACLAIFLLLARGAIALADPLVIGSPNGSFLIHDFEGDFFAFRGNGFDIGGARAPFTFIPRVPVPGCAATCSPGEVVDLAFDTPGEVALGSGRTTIGATAFGDVTYRGQLSFTAPRVTFPSHGDEFGGVLLQTPFDFSGTVRGFSGSIELFAVSLIGRGTASMRYFEGNGTFLIDDEGRRNYLFAPTPQAPTPEPATLLLTIGGAAAAWWRQHYRDDRGCRRPRMRSGG